MLALQQVTAALDHENGDFLQRFDAMLENALDMNNNGTDVVARGSTQDGDSLVSISELLGLNLPRGTLLGNTSNCPLGASQQYNSPSTPPAGNFQYEGNKFSNISSPSRILQRNMDSFNTPQTSPIFPKTLRGSSPYSDCSSPTLDKAFMRNCNNGSRSVSPTDSESPNGVGSLNDLMNYLSLNQPVGVDQDLLFQHGLSPVHQATLRYLQQQQHQHSLQYNLLSSLLHIPLNNSPDRPWPLLPSNADTTYLERAARFHRNFASLYDATCTWSGNLPARIQKTGAFSCKVFLGGVPWDISESALVAAFRQFGPVRVQWPGKEQAAFQPKGYAYIIFDSEKQVKLLLQACTHVYNDEGNWYYKVSSRKMKAKQVQVIPWLLSGSNYVKSTSQKLDPQKTVFVGALHGMLNAEGLATIMNDLFDGVVYAGIDTDKYKYPIGSGRVTFNNPKSFMRAVAAACIEIRTAKFTKKVQVDPYLEDSLCSVCNVQQGPYFCREMVCFRYFCRSCWHWQHTVEAMQSHKPLMRNSKASQTIRFNLRHTAS